jgi:predicted lipoprotein with Yx(FWY)xxD motif
MHFFSKWSLVRNLTISATFFTTLLGVCMASTILPVRVSDGILTGPNGMTLYTFDKDVPSSSKSVCNGPCANNWPPLFATETDQPTGDYAVINRDDGKKQWTAKGKPLYFWTKDGKPGDKTGEGFNGVWKVATP